MTVPVFVDTNVLVHVRDATEPDKQRAAAHWMAELWERGSGHLSYQVLKESYVWCRRSCWGEGTSFRTRDRDPY